MKKRVYVPLVLLILILAGGAIYLNPLLPIITGYAAKNLASAVFVSERQQATVESVDLSFFPINLAKNHVNFDEKCVTSNFLWGESKAIYVKGYGAVLVKDFSEDEIRATLSTQIPECAYDPDTILWPTGNILNAPTPEGIDLDQLNGAIDKAMGNGPGSIGTFAVAVSYKGELVAERYAEGFSKETKLLSWSMGKSITNTLIGIRQQDSLINIHDPAPIQAWSNDDRKIITTNNLMQMNSGLEWNENYGNLSDVTVMLHLAGDMAKYTYSKPMISAPNKQWLYSSGTTNVVSYILRQNIGNDANYFKFPHQELFNKIGMVGAVMEPDASGTYVGSSYVYCTMRDFIRYGLLHLNNGQWNGEQILPVDWVDYISTPAPNSDGVYGSFFYLNQSKDTTSPLYFNNIPSDAIMCNGHDGQRIYMIPSKDLVVVRTGFSKGDDFDFNGFMGDVLQSIE